MGYVKICKVIIDNVNYLILLLIKNFFIICHCVMILFYELAKTILKISMLQNRVLLKTVTK